MHFFAFGVSAWVLWRPQIRYIRVLKRRDSHHMESYSAVVAEEFFSLFYYLVPRLF